MTTRPPPEVGRNYPVPPMLTATPYDTTHPVPLACIFIPYPAIIITLKLQAAPTDQLFGRRRQDIRAPKCSLAGGSPRNPGQSKWSTTLVPPLTDATKGEQAECTGPVRRTRRSSALHTPG